MRNPNYSLPKTVLLPHWVLETEVSGLEKFLLILLIEADEKYGHRGYAEILYGPYAETLHCAPITVSRALKRLEEAGLVRVEHGPSDRSLKKAHISYPQKVR